MASARSVFSLLSTPEGNTYGFVGSRGATNMVRLDACADEATVEALMGTGMDLRVATITYKGGDGRVKEQAIRCISNVNAAGKANGRRNREHTALTEGRIKHYNKEYKTVMETTERLRHKWALKKVKAIGLGDKAARKDLVAALGRAKAKEFCESHGVSMDDDGLGADREARGGAGF